MKNELKSTSDSNQRKRSEAGKKSKLNGYFREAAHRCSTKLKHLEFLYFHVNEMVFKRQPEGSHQHCRLAWLFLKKPKHYFQKVQQLCCYVTNGEHRHHCCSDYCRHINPNCTRTDKEEELLQPVWAWKKDLFDKKISSCWIFPSEEKLCFAHPLFHLVESVRTLCCLTAFSIFGTGSKNRGIAALVQKHRLILEGLWVAWLWYTGRNGDIPSIYISVGASVTDDLLSNMVYA